jgi:hypothetical protein
VGRHSEIVALPPGRLAILPNIVFSLRSLVTRHGSFALETSNRDHVWDWQHRQVKQTTARKAERSAPHFPSSEPQPLDTPAMKEALAKLETRAYGD